MNYKTVIISIAVLLLGGISGAWAEDKVLPPGARAPLDEVKETIAKLVEVVAQYPDAGATAARREALREVISPKFDFEEMAKRSLGKHWSSTPPEQRDEFVDLFSSLLATTYLKRIENIRSDTVGFQNERLRAPYASVRTIVRYQGEEFPLDYRLKYKEGGWQVYDVIIENVGLVANYRNEFAGIIRREKFSGLLKLLRDKVAASD